MQNTVSIEIDHSSETPKYLQIANIINEAIGNDELQVGDALPSVNYLCDTRNLSRDTVFKAYSKLKENGVIKSVPTKGYFVAGNTRKVLLVLDTFKAYKEVLYHSFTNNLPDTFITDVQFHHYNIDNFKTIINNSVGKYYKYVVMGFDDKRIRKILSQIDSSKLLLLDWNIHASKGSNYVVQDFGKSFKGALEDGITLFRKYNAIHFLYPDFTDHPIETVHHFEKFCNENDFEFRVLTDPKSFQVEKHIAYISVSDRMLGQFLEQCKDKELEPGVDVGFLSYNETPMKKFIYKGISVVSTDFKQLGTKAAQFVMDDGMIQEVIPTKLTLRESL